MEVQKKHAALAALTICLLVGLVGFVAFNQGTDYGLNLAEDMDVNKEAEEWIGATVYWYKNGELVASGHNTMCNLGLNESRNMIADGTYTESNGTTLAFKYIAIGTGTGQGAGDNVLATEFARAIGTFAEVAAVNGNWTLTYTWSAGAFAGETIQEAGVFNHATTGTMLNVQSFTGIVLQATDSLQVQFMFQIS